MAFINMPFPNRIVLTLGACALAAGLGWAIGRPRARESLPEASPARAIVPALDQEAHYQRAAEAGFDPRNGRSLKEILAAVDSALLNPMVQATVDTAVSGELFALVESLESSEIPLVLDHLMGGPPPTPDRLVAAVLGRWARHDGAAAMAWMERLSPARQDTMRGPILSGWARQDPEAAWNWYQEAWASAPDPRYRFEQDFALLIHAWAQQDAPAALSACLAAGKHGTFDKWAGLTGLVSLPAHRDDIMSLITGIEETEQRKAAIGSALRQWAASAPAEAAAWIDAHHPEADGNLLWAVAERFGRANPRANADWLLQRTPPDQRDEAYRLCLYQWAEIAPDEAAAWLLNAGPTDMSSEALATRFARVDLDKAMDWARRVSPAKRADAVANVLACALLDGKKPDVVRYAGDAGLSPEELSKKVEAARQQIGARF